MKNAAEIAFIAIFMIMKKMASITHTGTAHSVILASITTMASATTINDI